MNEKVIGYIMTGLGLLVSLAGFVLFFGWAVPPFFRDVIVSILIGIAKPVLALVIIVAGYIVVAIGDDYRNGE